MVTLSTTKLVVLQLIVTCCERVVGTPLELKIIPGEKHVLHALHVCTTEYNEYILNNNNNNINNFNKNK